MSNIQVNQGTQTTIATDVVGTVNYQVVKLDIGATGVSSPFTGTFLGGTINAGTSVITVGTVDTISQFPPNNWGTVISSGTNTIGTIKPAVSGSVIYVTDLIVSVGSPSNVVIASGGTATPIAGTFFFNPNGGVAMAFRIPLATASGSALVYQQTANGPMTITAQGYVK